VTSRVNSAPAVPIRSDPDGALERSRDGKKKYQPRQ